mmetsp:Transcript_48997/g.118677  ORF Transcript_48997/g.118677 Transcript_48997/m.118677 type:complete len:299 (-) Transcript_48997:728-1624(-)|eukprot:CAMPEP_0113491602 /NCGR_PEP_ID=MMETSP0014_2-20120614/27639_1 /TAXON_ID=2857 /ORGANISM="Nitzschia sp." /LENGTH=298 /DNA_ID=CAMNT_0000385395 /DNA_START=160 /DNA_END=1056 /DNA_ORIENTATION=- /assembly_acc=CAM_ASM_000159
MTTHTASHPSSVPSTPVRVAVPIKGGGGGGGESSGSSTTHAFNNNNSHNNNAASTSANTTPQRPRMNSRDIPRSYSGLYGQGGPGSDDLLPFELARNEHTDWLENGGLLLLGTYLGGIIIFQVIVLALLDTYQSSLSLWSSYVTNTDDGSHTSFPLYWSWTITNAIHCVLTTTYLHWLKGSLFDEQGEMSGMTLWEQLEGRSNTSNLKRVLTAVPTLLCYAACHFSHYETNVCFLNVLLWSIQVVAKMSFMNGVRIFGINKTTGIEYSAPEVHGPPMQHTSPTRRRLRSYDGGPVKLD